LEKIKTTGVMILKELKDIKEVLKESSQIVFKYSNNDNLKEKIS
jgi:hypothetical protein